MIWNRRALSWKKGVATLIAFHIFPTSLSILTRIVESLASPLLNAYNPFFAVDFFNQRLENDF
jgi:hypothetical protein